MQKTYNLNGETFTLKPYSIRMLAKYNLQIQLPLGLIVPQKKKEFKEKYNLDTSSLDRYTEKIAELEEIISSFTGELTDEDKSRLDKFRAELSGIKTEFANDKQAQEAEYQFMRINDACTIDLLQDESVMKPLFPELLEGDVSKINMELPEYNAFIKEVMLDFFSLINPKTNT